jgi:hypothetical protein
VAFEAASVIVYRFLMALTVTPDQSAAASWPPLRPAIP